MEIAEIFGEYESQQDKNKKMILDGLNDSQIEVVKDYKGFSMVSAGPGAGKSATIVRRTAYMIEDGIPSSSILLFTFTKKAANELYERVQKFCGDKACGVTISTYHSFCARQLRRYCAYAGYHDNFSIIDDEPQKKIVTKLLKDTCSNTKPEVIMGLISRFKDKHLTPQQAAQRFGEDTDYQEAVLLYERYQAVLRKNNAMDFDDLLFNMTSILEQNDIVRQQMHNHYRWIVADECQDSSYLDVKFIFLLANPLTMNLCLVGDSDQSIYGFRGADIENFFGKVNGYKHKSFVLGQNYRSTPEIVNGAQSLIRYNFRPDAKDIVSMQKSGEKILNLQSRNQTHEADQIASIIMNGVKTGELEYKDVAILFRNSFLMRNVEGAFVRLGVPYQMVSGVNFFERKEIKDILSFLDFLVNPENLLSLERILNIPKRGLGEKSVEKISTSTSQKYSSYAIISTEDALRVLEEVAEDIGGKAKKSLLEFIGVIKELYVFHQKGDSLVKLIDKVIELTSYNDYLRTYDEENYDQRLLNIAELKNMAATYDDLYTLVCDLVTQKADENTKDSDNKVSLMTMHASKGLEYRLVIIADAVEGIIPSYRCQSEKDRQEERRLFYVAMTRAKENLVICHPETMIRQGRPNPVNPSSFIEQISSDYLISMAG